MVDCNQCPLIWDNGLEYKTNKKRYSYGLDYIKYIQISPDGIQLLEVAEGNKATIHSFETSFVKEGLFYRANEIVPDAASACDESESMDDKVRGDDDVTKPSSSISPDHSILTEKISMDAGDTIFDAKWYPLMNGSDPITCCFATTTRDHPIHLWDAVSGQIRCSYLGYNHYDELDSAYSLAFNMEGDKLYCGANKVVRIFDISYPGRNYMEMRTCLKRNDVRGQKGILSCISFNPDFSKTFALGSYANSVGVYVENDDECALEIRNLDIGGVACVRWSPCGKMLWIGGRNCDYLSCWDVRKTQKEIGRVERTLSTNQKLHFDIDPWGKYLVTGSQLGEILVYDTTSFKLAWKLESVPYSSNPNKKRKLSDLDDTIESRIDENALSNMDASSVRASTTSLHPTPLDCVNAAIFHPYSSYLVTATGQRHFQDFEEIANDINSTDLIPLNESGRKRPYDQDLPYAPDSGIQIWKIPYQRMQI